MAGNNQPLFAQKLQGIISMLAHVQKAHVIGAQANSITLHIMMVVAVPILVLNMPSSLNIKLRTIDQMETQRQSGSTHVKQGTDVHNTQNYIYYY